MPEQPISPRFSRLNTIRNRLLIIFVALVVLPVAANGAIAAIQGASNAEQHVIAQLESVATLKEAKIKTWLDNLQVDLSTALIAEDVNLHLFFLLQASMKDYSFLETSYRIIEKRFLETLSLTNRFDELFVVDLNGEVVFSTDATRQGRIYENETLFQEGLKGFFVQPPGVSLSLDRTSVFVARPITDEETNDTQGLLVGRATPDELNSVMLERAGLGNSGETYLVSSNNVLLTPSRFEDEGYVAGETTVRTTGVNETLRNLRGGTGSYDGYRDVSVIGVYKWLPELQLVLVAEQDRSEALSAARTAVYLNGGVAAAAVLLALLAGLLVTRNIATPLAELATTATQIASGDLDLTVPVRREDEIGELARSFNRMTAQLRELISGLEQRVAERTRDLEQRSAYLEASAEVARAASSILETERLIQQVVQLIRERFNLYYAGLFQVDEDQEWAILQAGTGEAGKAMLSRCHRIKIGEGMIGWSIAHAQVRIASRAETDAVRLNTPELPHTRSEAAIPLRSRGQVLGALTVQSDRPEAFDQDLLTALQTMADQVAVALDNARLFAASETALAATQRAYGQITREAWARLLRTRASMGFLRDKSGIVPITTPSQPSTNKATQVDADDSDGATLVRSVKVREGVIGMVNARKPRDAGQWTAEETELLETLIENFEQALESARLYQETQRRAQRERIAREITAKVRAAPNIATIAETASEELVKALGGARGFVKFYTRTLDDDGHKDTTES